MSAPQTVKRLASAQNPWRALRIDTFSQRPRRVAGGPAAGVTVKAAADEVAEGMAAEGVGGEHHHVDDQDQGAQPDHEPTPGVERIDSVNGQKGRR